MYVIEIFETIMHQIKLVCARKIQVFNQINTNLTANSSCSTASHEIDETIGLAESKHSILNIGLNKTDHDLEFSVLNY